jgi:hypothetical protein
VGIGVCVGMVIDSGVVVFCVGRRSVMGVWREAVVY